MSFTSVAITLKNNQKNSLINRLVKQARLIPKIGGMHQAFVTNGNVRASKLGTGMSPGSDRRCNVNLRMQDRTLTKKSDSLQAIAAFNQSYLLLAQRMLGEDREQAKRALGLSDSMATRICSLTAAEIEILADSSDVICQFRVDAAPGRA
ncbi:flagellar transcriptional regulator FlhD [Paraburkholderia nemoris]|uniref:flagellar transcriptional regulator FlhD n=1 Tax=Paraburkholderia nemoris TaxID=2793076 RepID=UPI0038B77E15